MPSKNDLPKLLVVEDDIDVRETIIDCLSTLNADIMQAENGKLGLESALKNHPHAVMTDINMPVMNGLEMLRQLRASGFENPIIVLSAFGDKNNTVEALRSGATDFLTKPFDADQLIKNLEKNLKIGQRLSEFESEWEQMLARDPELNRASQDLQLKKRELLKMKWMSEHE